MAIFTVGPNSTFPSIAAAMAAAGPGDTIQLEAGYSNETATVTHSGMTITGGADSLGIVLELGSGIATVTLAGTAPIDLRDASDGNGIVGNDGDNLVTVTAGADSVSGGGGEDRLFVDYRLATGAVTGNSTSNVAEAGGGGRLVTINGGFEHFTIWTGSGADTITTGDGDDDIRTGEGAGTVTAGEGANTVIGGSGADTITAGGGGNFVDAGDGTNTVTTGGGVDEILTGIGADTIVAGAGSDRVTVTGGSDTVDAGADSDLLIVDYSAATTNVIGGVTGGNLGSGYTGHLADAAAATLDFVETERFWITTGSGDDIINTGAADDRISTGDGNDTLIGGEGVDIMTGGSDDDSYFVDQALDQVIEIGGGGTDTVLASTSYKLAAGSEVEVLSTTNGAGTAAIALTGNEFGQVITGNAGNNFLYGFGGADTLDGGAGDDVIIVDGDDLVVEAIGGGNDLVAVAGLGYALNAGAEVETLSTTNAGGNAPIALTGNEFGQTIIGNAGNNFLNGGGGADTLNGGAGDDIFIVDGDDLVVEAVGGGNDLVAALSSYALNAGAEVETLSTTYGGGIAAIALTGNEFGQAIIGNAGDNFLNGGGGADTLNGGAGDDVIIVDGDDLVVEALGGGNDLVAALTSYALNAGAEVETLSTTNGGNNAAIDLTGNEFGQTIIGNAGANILTGGGGADAFAFTSALGAGNVDTISDMTAGTDKIALDDAVFTAIGGLGQLSSNAFVVGSTAADADDRIIYNSATGALSYDADGNGAGAAVQFASLSTGLALTASDFFVI